MHRNLHLRARAAVQLAFGKAPSSACAHQGRIYADRLTDEQISRENAEF